MKNPEEIEEVALDGKHLDTPFFRDKKELLVGRQTQHFADGAGNRNLALFGESGGAHFSPQSGLFLLFRQIDYKKSGTTQKYTSDCGMETPEGSRYPKAQYISQIISRSSSSVSRLILACRLLLLG